MINVAILHVREIINGFRGCSRQHSTARVALRRPIDKNSTRPGPEKKPLRRSVHNNGVRFIASIGASSVSDWHESRIFGTHGASRDGGSSQVSRVRSRRDGNRSVLMS